MSERETVTVRGRELFLDDEKVCVEVGDGDWAPLVIADSAPEGPVMFLSDIFKAFLAERQRREQAEADVRWLLDAFEPRLMYDEEAESWIPLGEVAQLDALNRAQHLADICARHPREEAL